MLDPSKDNRLHVTLFGKRNSGKSTLMNVLAGGPVSIVTEVAGTTTDPVFAAIEFPNVGPVMLIDTAGIDAAHGDARVQQAKLMMDQTDLALLLFTEDDPRLLQEEKAWHRELARRSIPVVGVVNRIDEKYVDTDMLALEFDIPFVKVSAKLKTNIGSLREAVRIYKPIEFERQTVIGDLVQPGDAIVYVFPQELQASRGKLPQLYAQCIRETTERQGIAMTTGVYGLSGLLARMNRAPELVVCDPRLFERVNELLPAEVPLTTFSILTARFKGDLDLFLEGAQALETLRPGDKILFVEACGHHSPGALEPGREQFPLWLSQGADGRLDVVGIRGGELPADLSPYKLILHCGSCTFNRKQVMARLLRSAEERVPITNYAVAAAHLNGSLKRMTAMFLS